ncbi:MAG: GNAT family N-acetyltransferase, partial [Candidatus Omnitrophota bacterium]
YQLQAAGVNNGSIVNKISFKAKPLNKDTLPRVLGGPIDYETQIPKRVILNEMFDCLAYSDLVRIGNIFSTLPLLNSAFWIDIEYRTGLPRMSFSSKEKHAVVQLAGPHDLPDYLSKERFFSNDGRIILTFVRAAKIAERLGFSAIDLNMGSTGLYGQGKGGVGFTENPDLAERLVREIKQAVDLPVSVKTRIILKREGDKSKGSYKPDSEATNNFIKRMVSAGAEWIVLHTRTRLDGVVSQGTARPKWDYLIPIVEQNPNTPVFANGEIFSIKDAREVIKRTGCYGVMIASKMRRDPSILYRVRKAIESDFKENIPEFSLEEKLAIAEKEIEFQALNTIILSLYDLATLQDIAGFYLEDFTTSIPKDIRDHFSREINDAGSKEAIICVLKEAVALELEFLGSVKSSGSPISVKLLIGLGALVSCLGIRRWLNSENRIEAKLKKLYIKEKALYSKRTLASDLTFETAYVAYKDISQQIQDLESRLNFVRYKKFVSRRNTLEWQRDELLVLSRITHSDVAEEVSAVEAKLAYVGREIAKFNVSSSSLSMILSKPHHYFLIEENQLITWVKVGDGLKEAVLALDDKTLEYYNRKYPYISEWASSKTGLRRSYVIHCIALGHILESLQKGDIYTNAAELVSEGNKQYVLKQRPTSGAEAFAWDIIAAAGLSVPERIFSDSKSIPNMSIRIQLLENAVTMRKINNNLLSVPNEAGEELGRWSAVAYILGNSDINDSNIIFTPAGALKHAYVIDWETLSGWKHDADGMNWHFAAVSLFGVKRIKEGYIKQCEALNKRSVDILSLLVKAYLSNEIITRQLFLSGSAYLELKELQWIMPLFMRRISLGEIEICVDRLAELTGNERTSDNFWVAVENATKEAGSSIEKIEFSVVSGRDVDSLILEGIAQINRGAKDASYYTSFPRQNSLFWKIATDDKNNIIIASKDKEIVGYLIFGPFIDYPAYIYYMVARPIYQKESIETELLKQLIIFANNSNIGWLTIHVDESSIVDRFYYDLREKLKQDIIGVGFKRDRFEVNGGVTQDKRMQLILKVKPDILAGSSLIKRVTSIVDRLIEKFIRNGLYQESEEEAKTYSEFWHDLKNKLVPIAGLANRVDSKEKFSGYKDIPEVKSYLEACLPLHKMIQEDDARRRDKKGKLSRTEVEEILKSNRQAFVEGIINVKRLISERDRFDSLDQSLRGYLESFLGESEEMLTAMDQIILWSGYSLWECKIEDIISNKAESYRKRYPRIKIDIKISRSLRGKNVFAYKDVINLSLEELLLNAAEHSETEKITIRAFYRWGKLYIQVKDFGKGIRPENIRKIFVRGYSTAEGKKGSFGGGLASVKTSLRLICAKIGVKSKLGLGTTFNVTMPLWKGPGIIKKMLVKVLFDKLVVDISGLKGSYRKSVYLAIACFLGLRPVNPGWIVRTAIYLLYWMWELNQIDPQVYINNPQELKEQLRIILPFINCDKEPVEIFGLPTTVFLKELGRTLRDDIKYKFDQNDKIRKKFHRIAIYPEVREVLEEFIEKTKESALKDSRYTGIILYATEPYGWADDAINIMFTTSVYARAKRIGWSVKELKELDKETGKEDYGPHNYSNVDFHVSTENISPRQAYLNSLLFILLKQNRISLWLASLLRTRENEKASSSLDLGVLKEIKLEVLMNMLEIMPQMPVSSIDVNKQTGERRYYHIGKPFIPLQADVYIKEGAQWDLPAGLKFPHNFLNSPEGAVVLFSGPFYIKKENTPTAEFIRPISDTEVYEWFGLRRVIDSNGEPFKMPALGIGGRSILLPIQYKMAVCADLDTVEWKMFGLEFKKTGTPLYRHHDLSNVFPPTVYKSHIGKRGVFLDWWHQINNRFAVGLGEHEEDAIRREAMVLAREGVLTRYTSCVLPLFNYDNNGYGAVLRSPVSDYRRLSILFDGNLKPNKRELFAIIGELRPGLSKKDTLESYFFELSGNYGRNLRAILRAGLLQGEHGSLINSDIFGHITDLNDFSEVAILSGNPTVNQAIRHWVGNLIKVLEIPGVEFKHISDKAFANFMAGLFKDENFNNRSFDISVSGLSFGVMDMIYKSDISGSSSSALTINDTYRDGKQEPYAVEIDAVEHVVSQFNSWMHYLKALAIGGTTVEQAIYELLGKDLKMMNEKDFALNLITGLGGCGKTTLIKFFRDLCEELGLKEAAHEFDMVLKEKGYRPIDAKTGKTTEVFDQKFNVGRYAKIWKKFFISFGEGRRIPTMEPVYDNSGSGGTVMIEHASNGRIIIHIGKEQVQWMEGEWNPLLQHVGLKEGPMPALKVNKTFLYTRDLSKPEAKERIYTIGLRDTEYIIRMYNVETGDGRTSERVILELDWPVVCPREELSKYANLPDTEVISFVDNGDGKLLEYDGKATNDLVIRTLKFTAVEEEGKPTLYIHTQTYEEIIDGSGKGKLESKIKTTPYAYSKEEWGKNVLIVRRQKISISEKEHGKSAVDCTYLKPCNRFELLERILPGSEVFTIEGIGTASDKELNKIGIPLVINADADVRNMRMINRAMELKKSLIGFIRQRIILEDTEEAKFIIPYILALENAIECCSHSLEEALWVAYKFKRIDDSKWRGEKARENSVKVFSWLAEKIRKFADKLRGKRETRTKKALLVDLLAEKLGVDIDALPEELDDVAKNKIIEIIKEVSANGFPGNNFEWLDDEEAIGISKRFFKLFTRDEREDFGLVLVVAFEDAYFEENDIELTVKRLKERMGLRLVRCVVVDVSKVNISIPISGYHPNPDKKTLKLKKVIVKSSVKESLPTRLRRLYEEAMFAEKEGRPQEKEAKLAVCKAAFDEFLALHNEDYKSGIVHLEPAFRKYAYALRINEKGVRRLFLNEIDDKFKFDRRRSFKRENYAWENVARSVQWHRLINCPHLKAIYEECLNNPELFRKKEFGVNKGVLNKTSDPFSEKIIGAQMQHLKRIIKDGELYYLLYSLYEHLRHESNLNEYDSLILWLALYRFWLDRHGDKEWANFISQSLDYMRGISEEAKTNMINFIKNGLSQQFFSAVLLKQEKPVYTGGVRMVDIITALEKSGIVNTAKKEDVFLKVKLFNASSPLSSKPILLLAHFVRGYANIHALNNLLGIITVKHNRDIFDRIIHFIHESHVSKLSFGVEQRVHCGN